MRRVLFSACLAGAFVLGGCGTTSGTTTGYTGGIVGSPTDGSTTAFIEADLKTALSLAWADGGDPLGSSLVYHEPDWKVGDETGFKTIHYPSYIAVLTKAIQELTAKVEALEAKVK